MFDCAPDARMVAIFSRKPVMRFSLYICICAGGDGGGGSTAEGSPGEHTQISAIFYSGSRWGRGACFHIACTAPVVCWNRPNGRRDEERSVGNELVVVGAGAERI